MASNVAGYLPEGGVQEGVLPGSGPGDRQVTFGEGFGSRSKGETWWGWGAGRGPTGLVFSGM
jgi:hypothetical protein